MIIVAGWLRVHEDERSAYLEAVAGVAPLARAFPGCWEFVQAADPVDPDRITVYERWESDEALLAFRESGPDAPSPPAVLAAEVRKYRIGSNEDP